MNNQNKYDFLILRIKWKILKNYDKNKMRGMRTRVVKRIKFNGFGLILIGFGLNSSVQKGFDLNGSKKFRT